MGAIVAVWLIGTVAWSLRAPSKASSDVSEARSLSEGVGIGIDRLGDRAWSLRCNRHSERGRLFTHAAIHADPEGPTGGNRQGICAPIRGVR